MWRFTPGFSSFFIMFLNASISLLFNAWPRHRGGFRDDSLDTKKTGRAHMKSVRLPELTNWECWEQNIMSASEKRIMVSWLVGEAWMEFQSDRYKRVRAAAFEHTGLAMTLTGKNDDCVSVEGSPESIELFDVEEPFDDDPYMRLCWAIHPLYGVADVAPVTLVTHVDSDSSD